MSIFEKLRGRPDRSRQLTASLFMHSKEKIERSEHEAREGAREGWGLIAKRYLSRSSPSRPPNQILRFALTLSSLAISSTRSMKE